MIGDTRDRDLPDVPRDLLITEVRTIGALRILVPLRSEHAPAAGCLKTESHAADAGEEIDEGEVVGRTMMHRRVRSPQVFDHCLAWRLRAQFPTLDRLEPVANLGRKLCLRKPGLHPQAAKLFGCIWHDD